MTVTKLVSLVAAIVIGAGLGVAAVAGVVSSNTAAPSHNPANAPLVNYGDSK
jgi:hypothetical protein